MRRKSKKTFQVFHSERFLCANESLAGVHIRLTSRGRENVPWLSNKNSPLFRQRLAPRALISLPVCHYPVNECFFPLEAHFTYLHPSDVPAQLEWWPAQR
jgi:hypothetical protein